jgi:hypothetical protein
MDSRCREVKSAAPEELETAFEEYRNGTFIKAR